MNSRIIFLVLILAAPFYFQFGALYSQTSQTKFMGQSLAQIPTVEDIGKKNLDFRFNHRFGDASQGLSNFFGLDKGANTLLSLDYGLTDRLSVGVARISDGQTYEVRNKFKILEQGDSFPFSVSFWGVAGQRTDKEVYSFGPFIHPNLTNTEGNRFTPSGVLVGFPQGTVDSVNQALETKLNEYTLTDNDKRSYLVSVLLARKFNDRLSIQVSPMFIHRNFVKYGLGNDRTGIDVGGRFKNNEKI